MTENSNRHQTETEITLEACHKAQPALDAFVAFPDDVARDTARYLDSLAGHGVSLGALHGVPIGVKDIIDVAGVPTRAGSAIRADQPPAEADAFVVAKLRAAGTVIVGKTKTVEFAFGGWGTNPSIGTPRNPWDPAMHRTPGGSSSGTGAAVGARLIPAGLGSDTGGSVRIPAAFCGCVGLKTSIGLVSRSGVVPLSDTFDTIGPLAENVRMTAQMLDVMQGEDRTDPSTIGVTRESPLTELERGISGLRLGRLSDETLTMLTPEVRASFEKAIHLLQEAGARIDTVELPMPLLDYQSKASAIISSDAYAFHAAYADDEAAPLNPATRKRMLAGRDLTARERVLAQREREQAKADFAAVIDRFDAIMLPTAPLAAIPLDTVDEDAMPMSLYTRFGNYLDLAALSVPIDLTPEGLPTSLQIVVRHLDDPLALRIGYAFEQQRGAFPKPRL